MRSRGILFVVIALGSALAACGGGAATGAMRPTSKLTEQDSAWFEDAVDFVADPSALTGRWAEDWDRDLRGRIARGDLVAIITVSTLQTQIDPEQRTTFRLTTQVQKTLKGKAPADLTLAVADDAPGYGTIEPARARLLSERFVVFAKWVKRPDGKVGARFHLSIASPEVVSRVRSELERNAPPERTILKTKIVEN